VQNAQWSRNEIDRFILHRLEAEKLQPTRPASKEHWLRRLTFDLTGLPPTLAELDAFLADNSARADGKVIDRLLKSPAFGERMALEWLDVVRYGDTDGLFEDHPRSLYPWRDWVVDAFNKNLPYSDFLTWQLAGDLLPKPNVVEARSGTPLHEMTPEAIKGLLLNPIYAGVGPYPSLVEDNQWVHACKKMIEEDGAEQFLVNLLYVLRECFDDEDVGLPDEST